MIVTLDFETFYSKDYSLTKMSEVEYIRDPRFQIIMCGVKVGNEPARTYVGHKQIQGKLRSIDWSRAAVLAHNTRFDGSILSWVYGIQPRLWLDTLSMARAVLSWHRVSSSLASLSRYFDFPPKGDEVVKAMGKRLEDFDDTELARYRAYCERDTENCRVIFDKLRRWFPDDAAGRAEIRLIDVILRMFIEPQVCLNKDALEKHLKSTQSAKDVLLARVEHLTGKKALASNQQFYELLTELGVDVPMKRSPSTGEEIPALARGDRAFKELCASSDLSEDVQAILAARVGVKSTLEETRTAKLIKLADLTPDRWAPVPLKYSGARTHRLSGDGGTNWQNIQRGSEIRKAIEAPPGLRIVHRDASQIEARMTAWMAGCYTILDAFQEGRDVYSEFASIIYGRTITREDRLERFVGKTAILGLGYGCGHVKFRHMCYIGNGGVSVDLTEDRAADVVTTYRQTYPEIPALWHEIDGMIRSLLGMGWYQRRYWIPIDPDRPGRRLGLPNGLTISYPGLKLTGEHELVYNGAYPGMLHKIYGAKAVENISQALSRIVVTDIILRVFRETGYHPFLTTHDSTDYCVPESDAEAMDRYLTEQFSIVPSWASKPGDPPLPLASEGGWGRTLFEAEKMVNQ